MLPAVRVQLRREARQILETAEDENRDLTPGEAERFDDLVEQLDVAELRSQRGEVSAEERARFMQATPAPEEHPIDVELRRAICEVRKGETRALTTSVAVSQTELSTHLFDKLRPLSIGLRSGFTVIDTDSDSVTFPALTADVAPGWYAEAAAITPGDPTLASVTATPRKLAHLVQLSNEVIDDSNPKITDILRDHVLKALALKLDAGFYEGSGSAPEIRGLKNVSGIQTVSMGTNGAALASLDPVADAVGLLEAANANATAIAMAPRTVAAIRTLKDADDRYLLQPDPTRESAGRLFGVPVFASAQLSITETQGTASNASSVYVYDAAQVVHVRRQEVELELDRSRLFNSDQSELRGKLRGDLIVPNPTAVVRVLGVTP